MDPPQILEGLPPRARRGEKWIARKDVEGVGVVALRERDVRITCVRRHRLVDRDALGQLYDIDVRQVRDVGRPGGSPCARTPREETPPNPLADRLALSGEGPRVGPPKQRARAARAEAAVEFIERAG